MRLLDLHLGRPLSRGALTLFPVWNGRAVTSRGYDLHSPGLTVGERPDAAAVGQLLVRNASARPALVLEGELLQGGRQDRVAARSALVGAADALLLDVRCVEEGRWSGTGEQSRSGRRAPAAVRAAAGQREVWQEVRRYEQRFDVSETHSLPAATSGAERDAEALVAGVRPLPFQAGVLVGIGGHPLLLEVYDSPRTLADAWQGLLRSAALDAVDASPVSTPGRRARRFVERLSQVTLSGSPAGLGTSLSGRTPYARLDGLHWRDRAVHAVGLNPRHELVAA